MTAMLTPAQVATPERLEEWRLFLSLRNDEVPTHVRDQIGAAVKETDAEFAAFAAELNAERFTPVAGIEGLKGTGGLLLNYMLAQRSQARGFQLCDHIKVGPRPAVANISARLIYCRDCIGTVETIAQCVEAQLAEPEALCDFCQAPTGTFHSMFMSSGTLMVQAELCDTCVTEFRSVTGA